MTTYRWVLIALRIASPVLFQAIACNSSEVRTCIVIVPRLGIRPVIPARIPFFRPLDIAFLRPFAAALFIVHDSSGFQYLIDCDYPTRATCEKVKNGPICVTNSPFYCTSMTSTPSCRSGIAAAISRPSEAASLWV